MGRAAILRSFVLAMFVGAFAVPALAQEQDFETWLNAFKAEALSQGIRAETLDSAFKGVEPIPRVIELDRNQPEFKLTFDQYLGRVVDQRRINKGRQKYAENSKLLEEIGQKYNVQPRFIVALWGIETDYGRVTGGFPVIASLATLAHDGRRSDFFRKQLMNAVTIIDQGHITADKMVGSWAGAMGQPQFMPSSFLNFAVDYDGDGRKNIWTSAPDVFASAANYLSQSGWKGEETWGRPVTLPKEFDRSLVDGKTRKPLAEWKKMGVMKAGGGPIPVVEGMQAALVLGAKSEAPNRDKAPVFLVYDNFETILKWNRSTFYALAAGYLADRVSRE